MATSISGSASPKASAAGAPAVASAGQLDDPLVLVRQADFALGKKHAGAVDAPDRGRLQGDAEAGNAGARRGEDALQPGAGVGRAANDLDLAASGLDGADSQLVGIGVRLGRENLGDDETGERRAAVDDGLHFMADHGQAFGDDAHRRVGFEVVPEPAEGEFHGVAPATSDGTSSAAKP